VEEPQVSSPHFAIDALVRLIGTLRGPDGCPWDREQTPQTMVRYLLEEAYELADAVAAADAGHVCEELGDLLFHVLFLAQLYTESGGFTLAEACSRITEKMERRHPHVFGATRVADSAEVVRNWQRIKQGERGGEGSASALDSVPAGMPGLLRAHAVSERAARARFDWENLEAVLAKLQEEIGEFREAVGRQDTEQAAREFGDVLFTLVNVARFSGVHPETALAGSIRKFERRFRAMEQLVAGSGRQLESVPQEEKDRIWERIKSGERSAAGTPGEPNG
jgi:MazG family protein